MIKVSITAIAIAFPCDIALNAYWYDISAMVCDAYPGPPCVRTYGRSNKVRIAIVDTMILMVTDCTIRGRVILQSFCHQLIPSTAAAS